jgi:hypothetical protein
MTWRTSKNVQLLALQLRCRVPDPFGGASVLPLRPRTDRRGDPSTEKLPVSTATVLLP